MANKLYYVIVSIRAVVAAENEEQAENFSKNHKCTLARDGSFEVESAEELTNLEELETLDCTGWDGGCLPFGADDDKFIAEYFEEEQNG